MHDLSLRGILAGAVIIAVGIGASLGFSWVILQATQSTPPAIEGLPLQSAPDQDFAAYLREKNARLEASRIPIGRAMQTIAE